MDKKALSERDICTKFIAPAIQRAGWDMQTQLREEVYITKGRIIVRGRMTTRAAGKRVDYILYYKPNIPLAIIEAKDNHPFRKGYIDAFAGTGYRDARRENDGETSSQALLLPDLAEKEPQALLDGSARLALKTDPSFDRYVFIERNAERCAQLEALKSEFPHLASDIQIRQGDANAEIQELCSKDWSSHRAVLFLDPYGMQVEWKTIEAIAATKAIDLWLLFPLGIGVNRLLTKSGDIPESWRRRLNTLLGTTDWYEEFYRVESTPTLFGEAEDRVVKATTESIGRYFNERLKSIFAAVADEPKVLRNSANCPLYLLCFAVGNEKGAPIALRIANHLLTKGVE